MTTLPRLCLMRKRAGKASRVPAWGYGDKDRGIVDAQPPGVPSSLKCGV